MAATPMKTKPTKKRTTNRPPKAKCDNTDVGTIEFQVYYSCDEGGEWECDESFATLEAAEDYCREKAEIYSDDVISGEDAPTPWEFYIYEVKGVRRFRYTCNVEVTVQEERL